jgi:hypothetical protein
MVPGCPGGGCHCANDLGASDPRLLCLALLKVASDTSPPDIVRASAGESLGQVAAATSRPLSESERMQLTPEARHEYDVFHRVAHHNRTRLSGEQQETTATAAEAPEATSKPLAQVSP